MADQKNKSDQAEKPYLVLARKYRPTDFSGLVGQDAMVQTFANAFKSGRVHHAFILTGVRGVGKTTTARILARAFNYENEHSKRPTLDIQKPGVHCQAIIQGRHVDVIEMDAASNTGIDDIREIIDSVKYAPASAPFKVYIIDEVHMLSKQAFNGLLKTLEEPPPYVKFIFATTEIRSVPITVLSRCQRFDLRRVNSDVMMEHLTSLLKQENVEFESDALAMIIRAGEGSVRDCLSLTDQAIAHGDGKITSDTVKTMLGLADRTQSIDLFEALLSGEIAPALELARTLYDVGVDPLAIISDLARFTHLVSRTKIVPTTANDISISPDERDRAEKFSGQLSMRVLTRTWQILQQGLSEISRSGDAVQAMEMVLIKLAYAADLPTPDELIKKLQNQSGSEQNTSSPTVSSSSSSAPNSLAPKPQLSAVSGGGQSLAHDRQVLADPATSIAPDATPDIKKANAPENFAQLIELASKERDLAIKHALETDVRPISFVKGHIEIALTKNADRSIVSTLATKLKQWTGENWLVSLSNKEYENMQNSTPTVRETKASQKASLFEAANADEMVLAVMQAFEDAQLVEVVKLNSSQSDENKNQTDKNNKSQDEK
ncbi:DNA polymerase III subunits gamma and tau [hydrothermal vent metagenome]|uniref:DNA-directed DNA polymerase n=1 Tax=hydrothermal vent metagenome TaxID=652676 RepID=A0A3B0TJ24_9ZZZZ